MFREPFNLYIQVGSEAGQYLDIELPEITCLAMGIDTVNVADDEMVKMSGYNILAQVGQSMMAQANQSNQGVLSLLG